LTGFEKFGGEGVKVDGFIIEEVKWTTLVRLKG
jgi:hypothetical protein